MSAGNFHVHGPHDHELEHASHATKDSMAGRLAVMTAIIATVGAVFSYMGGATQANAGLHKNEAAIKKTEAADQWAYYQSKGNKQNLAELAAELVPEPRRQFFLDEAKRYKQEKAQIQAAAEKLEAESKEWDKRSEEELHLHHRWAQATTALQVAIAVAAMALLTRSRGLVWGMFGLGAAGLALGVMAWFHV
jgi:lipopolysaccharide export LptBFGC system permease protein LptF